MADEAFTCFNHLLEAVPGWMADLESILKASAEKQEELVAANTPHVPRETHAWKRSILKASSLSSCRSSEGRRKDKPYANKSVPSPQPQFQHLTKSDELRLSQRKRKTVSVFSGELSGPAKFRIRTAVVYYDGEAQSQFEKLVRAIGNSRNCIRKSRFRTHTGSLMRTETSSSQQSTSGCDSDEFDVMAAHLEYKTHRRLRCTPDRAGGDSGVAFDQADCCLEKAQVLCERAAHQILRDGDCSFEIISAKEHLAEALILVKTELPVLELQAKKAEQRLQRVEDRRQAEDEDARSRLNEKVMNFVLHNQDNLEVGELEVDDSSDDGVEFDIRAFSKIAQMRSARLAAH